MCDIYVIHEIISYSTCSYDSIRIVHIKIFFCFFFYFFAGHQGSSQSDNRTTTGFGSFKLPTCDWLQKGRSHSHMESSLVFWLRCIAHGFIRGLRTLFSNKCLFRPIHLQVRLALQEMHGFLFV